MSLKIYQNLCKRIYARINQLANIFFPMEDGVKTLKQLLILFSGIFLSLIILFCKT